MNTDLPAPLPENIFETVFKKSPGSLLIKADLPCFTILAASDSYLEITSTTREAIIGKGFFEVFPDGNIELDERTNARHEFTTVIETGQKVEVPTYRFDVFNPETKK